MKLYVTYGFGSALKNCFSVVEGVDLAACRETIANVCGTKYAFTYTEERFAGQPAEFGLTEVPLQAAECEP